MDREQLIERESRLGRMAGILGLIGVVISFLPAVIGLAPDFNEAGDELAQRLEIFADEGNEVLAQLLIQATGLLLFAAPLFFLFQAAMFRSDRVRRSLIGLTIAGPLFYAGSVIASYFALDAASVAFLEPGAEPSGDQTLEDFAEDTLADQGAFSVASGLQLAGLLGLVFAVVYTSLQAMRVGLLSRFWGTLGMALGVGTLFIGLPALFAYFLAISLIVAGFWPGGRPPAWEAGEAMPWPRPGEQTESPPPIDEPARPEDFEGTGQELPGEASAEPGRKRKRKQRRST